MKKLLFALIITLAPSAQADPVENQSELALLPPYCRGAQQIRSISKDPMPIEQYMAIYGKSYYHFHHYCWALNSENKAFLIRDKLLRNSKLGYALGDIQYSLNHSEPGFVFLPVMYATQARILFTLHRDGEAAVALEKSIEAKPDYVPAIARLSDYFADNGDKAQAIKVLEQGIANTEKAATLIKKLEKLGKTYQGIPGSARKKEESAEDQAAPITAANPASENPPSASSTSTAPATPSETTQPAAPVPADNNPAHDPYCRFCP